MFTPGKLYTVAVGMTYYNVEDNKVSETFSTIFSGSEILMYVGLQEVWFPEYDELTDDDDIHEHIFLYKSRNIILAYPANAESLLIEL